MDKIESERIDELYGPGGLIPEHPSGNVLDALHHADPADPFQGVTVKHYDKDGNVLIDRPLTPEEREAFYGESLSNSEKEAIAQISDEFVQSRLST